MKIFSDQSFLPDGTPCVPILLPFWDVEESVSWLEHRRFDRYVEAGGQYFEMLSLSQADFAVLPFSWEYTEGREEVQVLAEQFIRLAHDADKPVIIFFWSDSTETVPVENAFIFRTSVYRSQQRPHEFAMPAWSEDLVDAFSAGVVSVRTKQTKPTIGYCGYAEPFEVPVRQALRRMIDGTRSRLRRENRPVHNRGRYIRTQALRVLSADQNVETNFKLRDRFFGHHFLSEHQEQEGLRRKMRMEFVQNLAESDYVLCARGRGNFSYRLYETLSFGRIPVFVDTDCVLPYDFQVDWRKYCVWVDETQLDHIGEYVADFHASLSPRDFVELQYVCRRFWQEWLSPEGFFANIHHHLDSQINQATDD